jgi:hypothetical protein
VLFGVVALLRWCGDSNRSPSSASTTPAPSTTPAAPAFPDPPAQRLPLGISEANPHLIAPGDAPDGFAAWRDRLLALRPARYRLFVDWSRLQPDPAKPAALAAPGDGCLRGVPPCGAYTGVREQLRAVAAARRAQGGMDLVVVVYGVPDWAAGQPGGCEREDAEPRDRPISDAGLRAYGDLLRGLDTEARAAGVHVTAWSPWNEPNHPTFISPQRASCDAAAPSASPAVYARLVRAARVALGPQATFVLGELAGFERPTAMTTGVAEFVRALPDDIACQATAWAQHNYAWPGGKQPDAVKELEAVLAERPCTARAPIWVTETGVGGPRSGAARERTPAALAAQCRALDAALTRWTDDPRVQAVFQYTFREDTVYPVGLADARLTEAYPTYDLLAAWSQTRPGEPPPALPPSCVA